MSKEKDLVETFNKHYKNIVGNSTEIKPYQPNIDLENNVSEDDAVIDLIIKVHENHPSIDKTKQKAECRQSM